MKKKVMLILLAVAVVSIAVPAVQAGITNNVLGGDIPKGAGWDNGKPASDNPGFITVDGIITDDTFGFGSDTVITQTAGTIDAGSKTMNFGAFNGTDGGGTWNMSGGTIIARSFNMNATTNSTINISGGSLVLNSTGIELDKGASISSSKSGSFLNISGTAVLDETNATKERNTGGNYDIASNWTGYWTSGLYEVGADLGDLVLVYANWKDFVVANITLDNAAVDAATFDSTFTVTDGGQTLAMVPEPATLSLLAIGGLALLRRRK